MLKWVQRLEHFLGAPLNWVIRQHGPFFPAPVVAWVLEWGCYPFQILYLLARCPVLKQTLDIVLVRGRPRNLEAPRVKGCLGMNWSPFSSLIFEDSFFPSCLIPPGL